MFAINPTKPFLLHRRLHHHHHQKPNSSTRLSATPRPSSPSPYESVPQPNFRPPPTSPLPSQFDSLNSTDERLRIVRDRLGLWFDYAPLISTLSRDGLSPSAIEASTGISSVEQNRLVVGAQVRLSLISSNLPEEILGFFESINGGPEILYELRLLTNRQRADAARYVAERNLDAKAAEQLARAIKDFPRRKGDVGLDAFSYSSPGDCLAYMHLRQFRENQGTAAGMKAFELAAEAAETEKARERIKQEGGGDTEEEDAQKQRVKVPVVRLKLGEAAQAESVKVFPICRPTTEELTLAPDCVVEETFGIVSATANWRRWVVLPGWEPIIGKGGGIALVEFKDGRILPWKTKKGNVEEMVLVAVDRKRRAVEDDDGLYVVGGESGGLVVERGVHCREKGVKVVLGSIVMVVRPPKFGSQDSYLEEDWD